MKFDSGREYSRGIRLLARKPEIEAMGVEVPPADMAVLKIRPKIIPGAAVIRFSLAGVEAAA
jgi:hypothetical protein